MNNNHHENSLTLLENIQNKETLNDKEKITEVSSAIVVDILRRFRTRILSTENSNQQAELLQVCETIGENLSKMIVDFIFDIAPREDFLESFINKVKSLIDTYQLNEDPTTLFSDSETNRQLNTHLEYIFKAISKPSPHLSLGWKRLSKNINKIRSNPVDLANDETLIVAPLSTGLFVVQLWNEVLLRMDVIKKPFIIETIAHSKELKQSIYHKPKDNIKNIIIIDDTVMNPQHGTVGTTHDVYKDQYSGTGVTIKSAKEPKGEVI